MLCRSLLGSTLSYSSEDVFTRATVRRAKRCRWSERCWIGDWLSAPATPSFSFNDKWIPGDGRANTVAPEVLFIQRAVEWLREGGRLGIVLPDGILGNPGDEPIRRWILEHCWVLASVDLPVETFAAKQHKVELNEQD